MNKLKTVEIGSRGQLVIPQEFRRDLGIEDKETLVIIESNNQLIISKQQDVMQKLQNKEQYELLSEKALGKVWNNKKDDVWEKYLR
ncbi:MAG: AbrB/MazE/SpoVT family DNA-binding domain-containing protein [archaeon]